MSCEIIQFHEKAVARLLQAKPSDNDIAVVAGLEKIFGCGLKMKFCWKSAGGVTATYIETVNRPRGITAQEISAATSALRLSLAPDSLKSLVDALRGLKAVTAHRSENAKIEATTYAVMAKELQQYPADVTREVISRSRHWFPPLDTFHEECKMLTQPRRAMLAHIEKWEPWTDDDESTWKKERIRHLKYVIHDAEKRHLSPGQDERKAEAEAELEQLEGEKDADYT